MQAQSSDMTYLMQLASQTGTDTQGWNPFEILAGIIPGDRRAINQRFFEYSESKKVQPSTSALPDTEINEVISKGLDIQKKRRLSELAQNFNDSLANARARYERYENTLAECWQVQTEMNGINSLPLNIIVDSLKELLTLGFWKFEKIEESTIQLSTIPNIVMREYNPALGVNRTIDLGQYLGILDLKIMRLRVAPFKNNLKSRGYWHPYVDSNTEICWGNAASQATSHLAKGEIKQIFSLLATLLTTYGTGTPWSRLQEFEMVLNHRYPSPPIRPTNGRAWCDDCDAERAECDCRDWCIECDVSRDNCEGYYCDDCEETRHESSGRCPAHWCSICEANDRDCECCQQCESIVGNCECCRNCNTILSADCCRDCNHCDGTHAENCSEYEAPEQASPESTGTIPF